MKILVTGFDPFGGEKINPAWEVVKRLSDNIGEVEVIKLQVPTAFGSAIKKTAAKIDEIKPNFVLNIGQAGGRAAITVERVAINVDDARIKDNEGKQPIDETIDPNGKSAYFATIPIKAIVNSLKEVEVPAEVSNTAGTYVCNHLMYGTLNHIAKNNMNIKAGFVHIPFLPEQVIDKKNMPSMSIETMVKGIEAAINTIATVKEDIKHTGGSIC